MWVDLVEELQVTAAFRQSMQIPLQVIKCQLVPWFVLAIFLAIFLDRIVSQMDKLVFHFIKTPKEAGSSHISLLVPISFNLPIIDGHHHVYPDIEFPPVVQKRVSDVFLYNQGGLTPIFALLFAFPYSFSNIFKLVSASYSLASI